MLVKNYKRTQNIVHVNQRMKYENVLSVQETLLNTHVSQKLETQITHCV